MNNLSWFIYLASVSGKLGVFFEITSFISFMALGFSVLCIPLSDGEVLEWKHFKRLVFALGLYAMLGGIVTTVTPSKDTMYAIAVSQYGEQLSQTDAVKGIASDATKALRHWLQKQIQDK